MISTFTAKYTKIDAGYMGQLVEWPEVITEGTDVEECREMLEDALQEMILASMDELSKWREFDSDFEVFPWHIKSSSAIALEIEAA
jgi:predicted RNase H-like HicB family nuclease